MQIRPINTVCHGPRSTTTPHRLEYFLSNKIQWQSRGRGKKKLNMKGKMIWRRRKGKVKIWWRRFAVNETAEGQSSERINQCRAVIGGGNRHERRFYSVTIYVYLIRVKLFFSLTKSVFQITGVRSGVSRCQTTTMTGFIIYIFTQEVENGFSHLTQIFLNMNVTMF